MKIEKTGLFFFVFLTILFIVPKTAILQTPQTFGYDGLEEGIFDNFSYSSENQIESRISINSVKVLFDEAHTTPFAADFAPGPISALGGFLNTIGFETEVNQDSELTSEYLSAFQILVLFFPQDLKVFLWLPLPFPLP